MMNLQRFGQLPVNQLLMAIIGSMSSICTLSGLSYWLVSGNSESKLYMMTSCTVSLFSWAMYAIQKSMPKNSRYTNLITPSLLFLVIVIITLYNPVALHQMWVALIFFPVMLSLLVEFRVYVIGSVIFSLYFLLFQIFGPMYGNDDGFSPIIMATTKGVYALGCVILGGIIITAFNQHKRSVEAAAFQQQKQQVINILQCFIPVVERKTQTSRKEIGEMSVLLKALVNEYRSLRVQDWEIDLLLLLHFVSKVKLPDYMFEKEGKLTEYEFEVVQEHSFMAKELCEGIPDFQEVEKAFLYHHEKVDGTGYPYRLAGDQIPMLSQMLGIVEVFLAMTTPRSYRHATSPREAYAEIQKLVGQAFRADIVDAFGKVID
ncbi:HD-GYP domain-containing protein [Paenibacillus sp. Soil787]|uniref:HD-GYP domain-containing protein n=1 Tax=Paenibacillus sp. Soil787 TaxID=1736411 RepID=UPI0009EB58A9|nr:HD domain-containing phosphohydrolase [Paenibacillus sp. Soil787]